jgi:hypothetical protein
MTGMLKKEAASLETKNGLQETKRLINGSGYRFKDTPRT